MKGFVFLIVGVFFLPLLGYSQEISNLQVELQENNIVVHYALTSPNVDGLYEIDLYSSHDNFNTPLSMVSGDVGGEIRSGTEKQIVWKAANELGNTYKGRVSVEIRARYYVPFVKIIKPAANHKAKLHRGKVSNIEWDGGNSSSSIRIDLLKSGQRIQTLTTIPNTGLYSWDIPTKTKTGSDYSLMLTDARNADDVVSTSLFSIKQKYPMALKIGAVLAVGIATYFLIPDKIVEIPDPPLP